VGRDLQSVTEDIKIRCDKLALPPGYILEYGGTDKEMQESFVSLAKALALSVVLVYMVMAIQYESFLYPFVIMFTMPTTVIGVVLGLLVTGRSFSVPAFIGLIMLAGIVVGNGIVLVDYINTLRGRGMEREEAIFTAGPVRLRPILMTTLTTVLAMVPLASGLGEGGESQAPMATVVIGGMTVSTILTLVLLPVVYTVFDDLGTRFKNRLRKTLAGIKKVPLTTEEANRQI
jgi:HAE1 family hydrophobic/amphiphilic exporter-1